MLHAEVVNNNNNNKLMPRVYMWPCYKQRPDLTCASAEGFALLLRKLDGSLRTQLELPRQPSEGCLLFGSFWSSMTFGARGPALVQEAGVKHH